MKGPKPKQGTIVGTPNQNNGFRYIIAIEGEMFPTYMQGMGAPKEGKVGDKGTLTYTTGASFGLWFWTPSRSDPTCGSCR